MHWRRRIGFIIPSVNSTLEPETYACLPAGVTAHFSRAYLQNDDAEQLAALRQHTVRCTQELLTAGVQVVVFGCTTGSLIDGPAYDQDLIKELLDAGAPAAITTSSAVVDSLRSLGVRTIAIGAPYETWLTARVADYLTECGFRVVNQASLGVMDEKQAEISPRDVYQLGRDADHSEAEALFLSCTNFPTLAIVDALSEDLAKPVISSNSASLWRALAIVGVKHRLIGSHGQG